ncbi:hypothetical protein [Nocardia alni]|uniref:hypothetical protein n=1 Tax=Nocardia alni TaxID=2815723 RepID=UPI001C21560C|nr:hypothetical protein [Nocardia alni]
MSQPNNRLITDAAEFLDSIQSAIAQAGDTRRRRDALTGSASVERGRITVVVNASGSIIATTFSENVDDLTYSQIARGTLQAAQQAAAHVRSKTEELLAPMLAARAKMPNLSDLIRGVPVLPELPTVPPAAPLTPPGEREFTSTAIEFEDAVEYRPRSDSAFDR